MSIKQNGGVFGRNPTFNDVTIEGDLIINGEVFTGLDFQGSWNASTNTPALASSTGTNGEFYIVSVAGSTDLNGITNWGIGDWAIFNGTAWQRVEGGADGNFNDLTANSLTVNSGTTNTVATFTSTDAGAGIQLTDPTGSAKVEASGVNLRVSVDDDAAVANSAIQFRVDGGTKATIDANGNLDVTGDVSIPNGNLSVGGGNITTPQDGAIQMATVTSASGDLWTGINTGANAYSSMPSELSIMNTADNTTNSFAGVFFQAGENSAGAGINSARIGAIRTGSINTDLAFATRGASGMVEGFRLDSNQNVSIPSGNLDVTGELDVTNTAARAAYIRSTTTGSRMHFLDATTTSVTTVGVGAEGNNLVLHGGGAEVLRGLSSGDVSIPNGDLGIGTDSPSEKLHVIGKARLNNGGDLYIDSSSSGVNYASTGARAQRWEVNSAEAMRIDSSGNVGIGEASSITAKLHIKANSDLVTPLRIDSTASGSDSRFLAVFQRGGNSVGSITVTGSATAFNTSSDYRLKEDVQPMSGATDRLKELKPVNFAWKSDGSRVDGFLAHEAQEVVPESVTGSKDAMMTEEYEVSPATGDIYTPEVVAVEGVEAVEYVAPQDEVLDEDGNVVTEAVEGVEAVEAVAAVEGVAEVIHSANVEQPSELEDGQLWRETTAQVMGEREVPDYQGIDQSKLVPLLVATIQELEARITALES